MITELSKYYEEKGILSTKFNCPFLSACSCGNPRNLIKGKAAYIGKYYEDHRLPRILFVSLDMGSDKDFEIAEKRTPEGVRKVEEYRHWSSLPNLLHWFETHYFAQKIAQVMGFMYQANEVNHIFAHTNSAKCCENKESNEMSATTLYKNCRSFIRGELEILDPEILVTQGGQADNAIKNTFPDISTDADFVSLSQIHERVGLIRINNHPVLVLRTIYPSWRNKRTILQREELYPYYLKAVKAFSDTFLAKQQRIPHGAS